MREYKLNTVCEEAACPNIGECWSQKHATMMILGSVCTRACSFCNVATGRPDTVDPFEPFNVAAAVSKLGLRHVVITSVDRDDLPDGGAQHFADVITAIRKQSPDTTIEVLTPDFLRKDGAIDIVVAARPDVYNHNLETVPRLYPEVRPGARYFHSLRLLDQVKQKDPSIFTKSGLMVGLGETKTELYHAYMSKSKYIQDGFSTVEKGIKSLSFISQENNIYHFIADLKNPWSQPEPVDNWLEMGTKFNKLLSSKNVRQKYI